MFPAIFYKYYDPAIFYIVTAPNTVFSQFKTNKISNCWYLYTTKYEVTMFPVIFYKYYDPAILSSRNLNQIKYQIAGTCTQGNIRSRCFLQYFTNIMIQQYFILSPQLILSSRNLK